MKSWILSRQCMKWVLILVLSLQKFFHTLTFSRNLTQLWCVISHYIYCDLWKYLLCQHTFHTNTYCFSTSTRINASRLWSNSWDFFPFFLCSQCCQWNYERLNQWKQHFSMCIFWQDDSQVRMESKEDVCFISTFPNCQEVDILLSTGSRQIR